MKIYGHHGFRRFVLCLGYKSWLIKEFFLRYREQVSDFTVAMNDDHRPEFHNNHADEDWEVTCAETGLTTATGGASVARARLRRPPTRSCSPTATASASVDISALLDFHYEQGRIGTVTGVHPTSRYGEMRVDGGPS